MIRTKIPCSISSCSLYFLPVFCVPSSNTVVTSFVVHWSGVDKISNSSIRGLVISTNTNSSKLLALCFNQKQIVSTTYSYRLQYILDYFNQCIIHPPRLWVVYDVRKIRMLLVVKLSASPRIDRVVFTSAVNITSTNKSEVNSYRSEFQYVVSIRD